MLSVTGCIRCIVIEWAENTNSNGSEGGRFTQALTSEQILKVWKIKLQNYDRKHFCLPVTAICHIYHICQLISVQQLLLKSSLRRCNNFTAHFNQFFCDFGSTYLFQSSYQINRNDLNEGKFVKADANASSSNL